MAHPTGRLSGCFRAAAEEVAEETEAATKTARPPDTPLRFRFPQAEMRRNIQSEILVEARMFLPYPEAQTEAPPCVHMQRQLLPFQRKVEAVARRAVARGEEVPLPFRAVRRPQS